MKRKILAVVLGALLAIPFSGVGMAAKKGKAAKAGGKSAKAEGTSGTAEIKLQAKLLPSLGASIDDFDGKIKYKKKTDSKGTEEEIDAHVESELPNATLGIIDETSAAASTFLLKIFQGSTATEKGSCILVIKEFEFEYLPDGLTLEGFEAGFAAKVKEKVPLSGVPTVVRKVGTCEAITLINNIPTSVSGVPDVVAGDTAGIYALTPTPGSTPLLSGIFQSGDKHDDHDDDHDDDDHEDEDD